MTMCQQDYQALHVHAHVDVLNVLTGVHLQYLFPYLQCPQLAQQC